MNNICVWCLHNQVCKVVDAMNKSGLLIDYQVNSCSGHLSANNSGILSANLMNQVHSTPLRNMDPEEVNNRSAKIKNGEKPKDINDLNIMKEMKFSVE